ncbi:MAG: DUF5119 domain-containing protein [Alistipes sp.]|nr:DUF5119 domain-containing protein [Alistipes sp.]
MKATTRLLAGVAGACVAAALLGGCRKDLCYNHYREAQIATGWECVWERDYGRGWAAKWDAGDFGVEYLSLAPGRASGVSVIDYDAGGRATQNFFAPDGGTTVLAEGPHSFLFYNNDTEYIVFNDMASSPAASATTTSRSRASFVNPHAGERTVNAPDVLYGAFLEDVPAVELHQSIELAATLRPLVYTYLIRYRFDQGAEHVSLARGALSGMAESVYLRDGRTSDRAATVLYDCTLAEWGVQAVVKSFGVPGFPDEYYNPRAGEQTPSRSYALNLEVRLRNGKTKSFEFDITDQMRDQPRGGVIVVGGLAISEEEIGSDSGFDVTVEDWGDYEDIDLPLNPAR